MRTRILILILLVVLLQLFTCLAILIFGGGFRTLKEYAYHILVEKTEHSSTYIQTELREKTVITQEHAEQLGSLVTGILRERGASIADVQTDRELDACIIEASAQILSGLLECSMGNDAYLILDTGGDAAPAALYLHAAEPDVSLEEDEASFDFYGKVLETARENRGLTQNALGYWSGFSQVTATMPPSLKYSLPLIAEDGTVYGVLGIGLTKETVFSGVFSPDENACYVLGRTASGSTFDILAHSGSASSTLLGSTNTLRITGREQDAAICRFETTVSGNLVGNVQDMALYGESSPYANEQWVLISVADRTSVLQPLLFLQRMLAVCAVLSLLVAVIVAVVGRGVIIRPLSTLSEQLRTRRKYNEVVRFQPSNIYEIDEITDAITQMHINVQGFSSQVSKMISVADVGLGTFMYDRTDDSVFVGQSLVNVLHLKLSQGEDIVMSRREFLDSIPNAEVRSLIAAGLGMAGGNLQGDRSEVHQIELRDGTSFWMRLGFTYSLNTAIGTVQDITDTMEERTRIEYERDHDLLTGLLNRPAYYRYLEELFRDKSKLGIAAFVMIDLDNLKYVNDTFGHAFGDTYITTAADALKKAQEYGGIVARLSGDEFNICLAGFSSKEEVRELIEHVRAGLLQSSCLVADGSHFKVGASMGVSWYPDDAESRELLMKYADFAMYTVKHSEKGGIAEFDFDTYVADSAKQTDWEELNRIIEGAKVRYAFQSIVSAKTGRIYGYEALMRVQSEIFKSPLELLSIAKLNAKLHEIERLTWTRSLADFQALVDAGVVDSKAHLFVNSIANHRLEEELITELEETYPQLLPQIVIEILESESADADSTARKQQFILRWGGQIALDDYGTGYNSEYALLDLHPGIIKIDRSIICGSDQDADRRMIIENAVKLARAKGILVLAEGVETQAELETVIHCGVDFLQGDYLACPLFEPGPIAPELTDTIRRLAAPGSASENGN